MVDEVNCPKCCYPSINCKYTGKYISGTACINCGYIDYVASASLKAAEDLKQETNIDRPRSFQRMGR
jgi:hypothetical protein